MIKVNEGKVDRVIRVVIGLTALVAGLLVLSDIPQVISLIIGAVALITGITGFCGLYALLGINTCPVKK